MANEEHLAILRQGVEVWNKWREENQVQPDLSGAQVDQFRMPSANLAAIDLSRSTLLERSSATLT